MHMHMYTRKRECERVFGKSEKGRKENRKREKANREIDRGRRKE